MALFLLFFAVAAVVVFIVKTRGSVMAASTRDGPRDMAEVQRLIASGQLISAIKLHRELTGLGLKESKDAVEAMALGSLPAVAPSSAPNPDVDARIRMLLHGGKGVDAIRLFREAYGTDLRTAKEAIDRIQAGL